MKCYKCDDEATIKQGHSEMCIKHYRFGQMRVKAKRDGKTVPSYDWLEKNIPEGMICPGCGRVMNWRQSEGASTVITLQHDRSGSFNFLCLACNTRHASMEKDSFYELPKDSKKCPSCGEIKPIEEFFTDNGKRWKNKTSSCKKCSTKKHYDWIEKNREKYNESRRKYYHERKNNGNPIPR